MLYSISISMNRLIFMYFVNYFLYNIRNCLNYFKIIVANMIWYVFCLINIRIYNTILISIFTNFLYRLYKLLWIINTSIKSINRKDTNMLQNNCAIINLIDKYKNIPQTTEELIKLIRLPGKSKRWISAGKLFTLIVLNLYDHSTARRSIYESMMKLIQGSQCWWNI